jgi:hypothetical protein
MKPCIGLVGLVCLVGTCLWAADEKPATAKGDQRSASLMKEAAKTRYTWSPEVTAVSGKFAWEKDGKGGVGAFHSELHKRGGFSVSAEGEAQVPEDVIDHISSMINHRVAPAPGKPEPPQPESVILVEDDERGPLVMILGDPMHSSQRVKDGKLVQVNRQMGGKRFTIDVVEFAKSPVAHRVYPSAFTVTWWDAATGKRLEKQSYATQGFHLVDGQMFPKAEKVVSEKGDKPSTLEIQYTDVKFEMKGRKEAAK